MSPQVREFLVQHYSQFIDAYGQQLPPRSPAGEDDKRIVKEANIDIDRRREDRFNAIDERIEAWHHNMERTIAGAPTERHPHPKGISRDILAGVRDWFHSRNGDPASRPDIETLLARFTEHRSELFTVLLGCDFICELAQPHGYFVPTTHLNLTLSRHR